MSRFHIIAFASVVLVAGCGPSRPASDQATITCPSGKALLDGVCVTQTVADYVACVRAQGAQLERESSSRLSADVGAAGIRAGGAHEVSDALQKHYAASDANVAEIIRTCNRLAGLQAGEGVATATQPAQNQIAKSEPQSAPGRKIPARFRWYYLGRKEESRVWSRTGDKTYQERYPDGTLSDFQVTGHAEVEGDLGDLLRRVPDNRQEFFIPYTGSKHMVLRMRNRTAEMDQGIGSAPWINLGEMNDIE